MLEAEPVAADAVDVAFLGVVGFAEAEHGFHFVVGHADAVVFEFEDHFHFSVGAVVVGGGVFVCVGGGGGGGFVADVDVAFFGVGVAGVVEEFACGFLGVCLCVYIYVCEREWRTEE